jgi:transposase-like protein
MSEKWRDVLNEPGEVLKATGCGITTTAPELERMYVEEGMSMADIGEELGVSENTVMRLMDRAEIERRKNPDPYSDKKYRSEDWLRSKFIEERWTAAEIANECDVSSNCVNTWLNKYGLRDEFTEICRFNFTGAWSHDGYPSWTRTGANNYVKVHSLVAIAKGADPHKVFSNDHHVHHRNGFKCDNRPSNLELVDAKTHGKYHSPDSVKWTDDDIRYAIQAMLNPTEYIE